MVHSKTKSRHILKIPTVSETGNNLDIQSQDKSDVKGNSLESDTRNKELCYDEEEECNPELGGNDEEQNEHDVEECNPELGGNDEEHNEHEVEEGNPELGGDNEDYNGQPSFLIQSNDDDSSRCSADSGSSEIPCITKFECVLCDMVFETVDDFKNHVNSHTAGIALKTEDRSLMKKNSQGDDVSLGLPAFEIQGDADIEVNETNNVMLKVPNIKPKINLDSDKHSTPSLSELKHVTKAKFKKMFLCKYCGKKFMSEEFLKGHLISFYENNEEETDLHLAHQKLKEFESVEAMCLSINIDMSSVSVNSKSLSQEDEASTKKPAIHVCKYCGKKFVRQISLNHHLSRCTKLPTDENSDESDPRNEVELLCTRCNSVFNSPEDLIRHRETTHNAKCPNEDGTVEYFCAHCNLQCPSQAKLYSHLQTHRDHKKNPKNEVYKDLMTVDTATKKWICNICQKPYSNKSNLRRHISLHDLDERKEFKCPFCSRVFQYQRYLQHHIAYMHKPQEEKEHECCICGLTCTTKSSLKRHMMLHTGELENSKIFECEKCHKKFKYKKELETHLQYHLDERPYPCDKCNYRARTYFNLMHHFGTHLRPKRKRNWSKQSDEKEVKMAKIDKEETTEIEKVTDAENQPNDSGTSVQ